MAIKINKTKETSLERPEMDPITRNKLRLSRAHRRLLSLGPDRVTQIEMKMVEGQNLTTLTEMIQDDWGEFRDVKKLTLMKELERFRKQRIEGRLLYFKGGDYAKQVFGEYASNIDVLQNMQRTVEMQQERVSKLFQTEREMPKILMEQMRREMYLLIEMYSKLLDMQMEMGLIKRAPKEFSLEVAASKAQQALEQAMRSDTRIESALKDAYRLIEGKYSRVDTRQ